MDPNLRQLHAFVHTYHLGSLTKAAERLYVTQAAVSFLIKQLEEVLGVKLFDRVSRSLKPTLAARELLPSAERTLRDMDELKAGARGLAQRTHGQVRLGVTSAVACTLIPPVLKAFHALFPGIKIVVQDLSPEQLIAPVIRDDVEFCIGSPDEQPEEVVLTTLIQDYLSVVCRADSVLAGYETIPWREIKDVETITVRHGNRVRALVDDAMAQIGEVYQPAYEVSFLSTALAMTAEGVAVSILPSYLVSSFQYTNLVARRLVDPVAPRNLYLITKRGTSLSPAAESFVKLLKDSIAVS